MAHTPAHPAVALLGPTYQTDPAQCACQLEVGMQLDPSSHKILLAPGPVAPTATTQLSHLVRLPCCFHCPICSCYAYIELHADRSPSWMACRQMLCKVLVMFAFVQHAPRPKTPTATPQLSHLIRLPCYFHRPICPCYMYPVCYVKGHAGNVIVCHVMLLHSSRHAPSPMTPTATSQLSLLERASMVRSQRQLQPAAAAACKDKQLMPT
jgi:hypothetical protein